ncbi:MAG: hypothetical protein ABJJ44_15655 [Paraglaciecola sp.]|uniref:hypothetical protein n=1 Tax=Paraglaciecola sp. TaxID=1920173 RepID=UPI0032993C7A
MNTSTWAKELQKSYQGMVNNVEKFVVKEGKSLQEAIHTAETTLENAKETSLDAIKEASKHLKDNLHIWIETAEEINQAYKDEINFDLAFASSSVSEKFKNIANSNTAQLIEFTTKLKAQAQVATADSHMSVHEEHNQWSSEHALWLDEIELWGKDRDNALKKLVTIEAALKQHEKALLEHFQVIKAHSNLEHKHEIAIADAEKDPSNQTSQIADETLQTLHLKERQIHAQHAEFHQAAKANHYKIMAMVNMLYKQTQKTK